MDKGKAGEDKGEVGRCVERNDDESENGSGFVGGGDAGGWGVDGVRRNLSAMVDGVRVDG
jgi:hypothetical protein